jgi:hypothetical protein
LKCYRIIRILVRDGIDSIESERCSVVFKDRFVLCFLFSRNEFASIFFPQNEFANFLFFAKSTDHISDEEQDKNKDVLESDSSAEQKHPLKLKHLLKAMAKTEVVDIWVAQLKDNKAMRLLKSLCSNAK